MNYLSHPRSMVNARIRSVAAIMAAGGCVAFVASMTLACSAGSAVSSDFNVDSGEPGDDSGTSLSDAGTGHDAQSATDATPSDSSSKADTGGAASNVENKLTFNGCAPDMSNLFVSTNVQSYDSINVSNATGPLNGGIQISLKSPVGTYAISSTQRSTTGDVINLFTGGRTLTNMCNSNAGCTYDAASKTWKNDPIHGTLTIKTYDPRNGKLEAVFDKVVVQSFQDASTCEISGSIKTSALGK